MSNYSDGPGDIARGLPPIELLAQIKKARCSIGVPPYPAVNESDSLLMYHELALKTFNDIEAISSLSESAYLDARLKTYFADLDSMTLGLPCPGLFLLAGSTGIGKTSFALNLARNITESAAQKVIYLSNDCSSNELLGRIWSSIAEIEYGRIATSRLQPQEWHKLGDSITKLGKAELFFSDKTHSSLSGFANWLTSISSNNKSRPSLFILDDLSRICASTNATKESLLATLRSIADEHRLRILLLAQSMPLDVKGGQRYPELLDIPCIDVVQSVCDLIWMIHRDEFWDADTSERGIAKLMCMKHKNGPVGTIRFNFYPQYSKYTSFEA